MSIESVDLYSNFYIEDSVHATVVSKVVFKGFQQLLFLNMSTNGLPSVHPKLTEDMPTLEQLDLSGNNVSESGYLPENMFSSNHNLRMLMLSKMAISHLQPNTFAHLWSLQSVNLHDNTLNSSLHIHI